MLRPYEGSSVRLTGVIFIFPFPSGEVKTAGTLRADFGQQLGLRITISGTIRLTKHRAVSILKRSSER